MSNQFSRIFGIITGDRIDVVSLTVIGFMRKGPRNLIILEPPDLFAYWVIFHAFLLSAEFSKSTFLKNYLSNTIRVATSLDPDQAQCFVWPDLGSNCLQRLSADGTSRQ